MNVFIGTGGDGHTFPGASRPFGVVQLSPDTQVRHAAALLGARTGIDSYWTDYERLWRYCREHFVDHAHGAWYRILTADNRKYSDEKSPAGKVDYHTMGACHDIMGALAQRRSPVSK